MIDVMKNKEATLKNLFGEIYDKWVAKYPVMKDKNVVSWLADMVDQYTDEGKDGKDFQLQSYAKYLQQYCDYNKANPSDLLNEEIDERNSRVKRYINFLMNCPEEGWKKLGFFKKPSDVSIRNQIQGKIKGFYSNRGKNISWGIKTRKAGANVDEIYLDRELIKAIQAKLESIQYRLINKFESQLGLRIGDVLKELTSGKYKLEKYKEHHFIRNFETQKEKVIINFLFFTQELSELLESAYPEIDLRKFDLTKLFITRRNTRVDQNNYLRRLKAIVKELGIKGNIKTHGIRKYFETQVNILKDDRFKTHLVGAEPNYRDAVYDTNLKNLDYYYNKWLEVEKIVCVDCIIVDKTAQEIVKLKKEMVKKDEQINVLIKQSLTQEKKLNKLEELIKKKLNSL